MIDAIVICVTNASIFNWPIGCFAVILVRAFARRFAIHFERKKIMSLDPMKTVRELAVALPNVSRVFEKTKIDYCCGGDQLLGAACANAGVDLQILEQMLETTTQPTTTSTVDFQDLSAAELIQYILEKHHVYTRDEMQRLEALVEKVVTAHGANHSELLSI